MRDQRLPHVWRVNGYAIRWEPGLGRCGQRRGRVVLRRYGHVHFGRAAFERRVVNWRENLPDPVAVPLAELSGAISDLDRLLTRAITRGDDDLAQDLDAVVGRMTGWVWPLLRELDEDDDYDG